MADSISKVKRHEIMSKVKGKDTKIEIMVRHWLYHHGIRYRKNCKDIAGKPDVAIKKYKIVIFVNGCFWHGHEDCKYYRLPKSNVDYWTNKINKNIESDYKNIVNLKSEEWNVFVLWECQLKKDFEKVMDDLLLEINKIRDKKDRGNYQIVTVKGNQK